MREVVGNVFAVVWIVVVFLYRRSGLIKFACHLRSYRGLKVARLPLRQHRSHLLLLLLFLSFTLYTFLCVKCHGRERCLLVKR